MKSKCCDETVKLAEGSRLYEVYEEHMIRRGATYFYWCPKCQNACGLKEEVSE